MPVQMMSTEVHCCIGEVACIQGLFKLVKPLGLLSLCSSESHYPDLDMLVQLLGTCCDSGARVDSDGGTVWSDDSEHFKMTWIWR